MSTTPGHNPTLERRLVAACIHGGTSATTATAAAGVTDGTFADPETRKVWQALTASVSTGAETDFANVVRYLTGIDGDHSRAALLVRDVMATEDTSIHRPQLCRDVLTLAARRRLIEATQAASNAARDDGAREWAEIWAGVEPHLRAAQECTTKAGSTARTTAEIAASARAQLTRPPASVLGTGFARWDDVATPPGPGQLIVIAARPGMGKSAFAAQIAYGWAKAGKTVALFSLEMSAEDILTRLAKHLCFPRVPFNDVVADSLDALAKLSALRLFEVEQAKSVSQIEATCRLLAASPHGLGAVFIDYLQLVAPPTDLRRENREQQVAAMSRAFKLLARALGVPVFLLAQINRDSEKESRPPRLSDLRESGAIEQDADRVWFLHAPKDAETPDDIALLQAKCRNGPANVEAMLSFHRRWYRFATAPVPGTGSAPGIL